MTQTALEIYLTTAPGLENLLQAEATALGLTCSGVDRGGVTAHGSWTDVWRANLHLRGASRVLVRLGSFRALHLAQLDKRAHKFPWDDFITADTPVKVEVTCQKSRIYHSGAAQQRIEQAIADTVGTPIDKNAAIIIKVRIADNLCTISIDSSGDGLYRRGYKKAVNKAPLRENIAAMLLRAANYTPGEPVIDPLCGSGTFLFEAFERASAMAPGMQRDFAFMQLPSFDPQSWQKIHQAAGAHTKAAHAPNLYCGFDRDAGAIKMCTENATRLNGATDAITFARQTISDLTPPSGPCGLIITNPPYGARIGDVKKLMPLYQKMGNIFKERFTGWRVAIATNQQNLAQATGLKFNQDKRTFDHGGIPVTLFQTDPL